MPILMNCTCGKQLRVPDDYAGRRIKCPACGEAQTVAVTQASDTPPPPARAPAPSGMIRFACACGKLLQAREEYAGRMTRCPKCGEAMEIPGADAEADSEPRERIQAARPAPKRPAAQRDDDDEVDRSRSRRRPAARRDDDDEDYEEEVGRKRSPRRRRAKWPWLVAGGVLLLLLVGGGGVGAWLLLRGGGAAADLALVPSNAQGFVTIRVADVWKTDLVQKGVEQAKQQAGGMDFVAEMQKETGMGPADIERATLAFMDAQNPDNAFGILLASRPYDRSKILGPSPREKKHQNKSYQLVTKDRQPVAFHFASDKILVVGPEQGVQSCLGALAGKRTGGPLDDALKTAGGAHHLVGAFTPRPEQVQRVRAEMSKNPMAAPYQGLLDVRCATAVVDLGNTLNLDAALAFPTDAKAAEAKKAIDGFRGLLPGLMGMLKSALGKAGDQLEASVKAIEVEQKGPVVSLHFSTDMKNLVNNMGDLVPRPGGPAGAGPPGGQPGFPPPGERPPKLGRPPRN
jgi:hypothetical protein